MISAKWLGLPDGSRRAAYALVAASILLATSIPLGYPGSAFNKWLYLSHAIALIGLPFWFLGSERPRLPRPFLITAAAFLGWMLLASATAPLGERRAAVLFWARNLLLPCLVAGALVSFVRNRRDGFRLFRFAFLASCAVFAAFGLLEELFPLFARTRVLSEVRWPDSLRMYYDYRVGDFVTAAGLFEHYNAFGISQVLGAAWVFKELLTLVARFGFSRSLWTRAQGRLGLLLLFTAGIMASTSKTAIIAFAMSVCVLIWFRRGALGLSLAKVGAACALGAALLAAAFLANPHVRMRIQAANIAVEAGDGSVMRTAARLLQGRGSIYPNCIELTLAYPLKGIGIFQTARAMQARGFTPVVIHAHNLFLWASVEGGLVGLILLLGLFWQAFSGRALTRRQLLFRTLLVILVLGQLTELFAAHIFWYTTLLATLLALSAPTSWPDRPFSAK